MSNPQWRDARPGTPYGEPGAMPPGREPGVPAAGSGRDDGFDPRWHDPNRRGPGGDGQDPRTRAPGDDSPRNGTPTRMMPGPAGMTQPVPTQPGGTQPRTARPSGGAELSPGRGGADRSPVSGARRGPGRWGELSGGIGVGIIAASAAVGAIATMATRTQPGQVLGVSVVLGTFAAALAVRPSAGRLIFPAPVLFYLTAALAAGIFYDRSASNTQQAVDAAQWIANGFFAMAIATGLAIVLTTVRWYLWHRRGRVAGAPDRAGRSARGDMRGPEGRGNPGPPGARPAQRPPRDQRSRGSKGSKGSQGPYDPQRPDQRPGPRPGWQSDQYQRPTGPTGSTGSTGSTWPRRGPGPYNFSSGA